MTRKEIDAAKMLLLFNAIRLVLFGEEPNDFLLRIRPEDMMQCMYATRSQSPESICTGNVIAYYTHGENGSNSASQDYPEMYKEVERIILGNIQLQTYLSAVAEGFHFNGDDLPKERLKAANAFVESSAEKTAVEQELGIGAKGFWRTLFG